MQDVEPPPGYRATTTRMQDVEPPPGWKRNHPEEHGMIVNAVSNSKRRRKSEDRKLSGTRWSSFGRKTDEMLRVEILFETMQLIRVADQDELSEANQSRAKEERKRNPWRPVQEPLNRRQRLLSAKGRHSPSQIGLFQAPDVVRLKKGIRRLDAATLSILHSHLSGIPRLKSFREIEIEPDAFLPPDLWVRVLSFLDFNFSWSTLVSISHAWMQMICSNRYWSSINTLRLQSKFPELRDLRIFFRRLVSLREADFSAGVTRDSLAWLTSTSSQISDHVIRHLSNCKSLEVLDLNKCEQLTDQGFLYIAGSCHRLKQLCLTDCTNITDRSLQQLAFGCPGLKHVELRGCYQVTDAGLDTLCQGCSGLETVVLRRCRFITDEGIWSVAQHLADLQNLDLYSCHRITDLSLRHLSGKCKNIKSLILGGCMKVTDRGIRFLASGCLSLQKLDLFQTQVTINGVSTLCNCLKLNELNLLGTSVSQKDLEAKIVSHRKSFKIFL